MTPAYNEILAQIGAQLKERKTLLLKRTLLLVWPYLPLILLGSVFGEDQLTQIFKSSTVIGALIVYVICAVLYSVIMGFTFEIEKRIWVDSFFDKKDLDSKQSWNLAKTMFWKGVLFKIHIFFRYYLVPILILFSMIPIEIYLIYKTDIITGNHLLYNMLAMAAVFIGVLVYLYLLNVKLRYAWFIFIDTYSSEKRLDMSVIISQMNKLNAIMKSESFKKALVLEIGTDSVRGIVNATVAAISIGIKGGASLLSGSGALGQIVGGVTKTYGQELAKQATSYGNIVAMYLLYRSARKVAYGESQVINPSMYGQA